MAENNTIDQALSKVSKELDNENLPGNEDENVDDDAGFEPSEDSAGDDDNEDDDETESDENEDDPEEKLREVGYNLAKLISDPKTRKAAIAEIAKEAGFNLQEATTSEEKKFSKNLAAILQETLGDEYPLLPTKLADSLENFISGLLDARVKPVEDQLLTAKQQAAQDALTRDVEWAYTNLEGFQGLEQEVFAKMEEFQMGNKTTPRKYLEQLYKLVLAEKGLTPKTKSGSKTGRMQLMNGGSEKTPIGKPAPKDGLDIDQAISQAVKQLGILT